MNRRLGLDTPMENQSFIQFLDLTQFSDPEPQLLKRTGPRKVVPCNSIVSMGSSHSQLELLSFALGNRELPYGNGMCKAFKGC